MDHLEKNLKSINSVTNLVTSGLDGKGIINKIFEGMEVNFSTTTDLNFRCQCSRERIIDVLSSLSKDDLQNLIDDGQAEVACQFCGKKYHFDKTTLEELIK